MDGTVPLAVSGKLWPSWDMMAEDEAIEDEAGTIEQNMVNKAVPDVS